VKKWVLKAVVQKTISFLPYSNKINYFFQKSVTKAVILADEYFNDRLGHARDHLSAYSNYSQNKIPNTCLELGTGRYPIVPISFFLAGSRQIYSVDISFLTSKERIKTTIDKFLEAESKGVLKEFVPVIEERFNVLREINSHHDLLSLDEIYLNFI